MRPETPVTYVVSTEGTSPRFGRMFAHGCAGPVVTDPAALRPGPVALFGSPRLWPLVQQAMIEGRLYYGDHGYFGRHRYYRITKNGYQHDGTGAASAQRWDAHRLTIAPWRTSGRHIVVCPQGAVYYQLFGLDRSAWIADVVWRLRAHTDRPILVRTAYTTPLARSADLVDAWAVVTFSSNAAVEALIAGVPVFTLASFAASYRMGEPDLARIETPSYPEDRAQFCRNLAAQQWTFTEIRRGIAWRDLHR